MQSTARRAIDRPTRCIFLGRKVELKNMPRSSPRCPSGVADCDLDVIPGASAGECQTPPSAMAPPVLRDVSQGLAQHRAIRDQRGLRRVERASHLDQRVGYAAPISATSSFTSGLRQLQSLRPQ